jgi:glutamate dehydrogenase (NADP+)
VRLRKMMEEEGAAVFALARQMGVTPRRAAYVHALKRLAAAIEATVAGARKRPA